jgi:hypothetical protein
VPGADGRSAESRGLDPRGTDPSRTAAGKVPLKFSKTNRLPVPRGPLPAAMMSTTSALPSECLTLGKEFRIR